MADASHAEVSNVALFECERGYRYKAQTAQTDEENIILARPYVERANKLGIAVEVELGRLEGGEAGLRMISDAKLTRPEKATAFMEG